MDITTRSNQQKWDALVRSEVPCSRPYEDVTTEKAQQKLNPNNIFGELKGKKVLCLASGGGQQSIEFALLGAQVTVVDFSAEQLKKDQEEARKLSLNVRIIQSDMRDLSRFEDQEFDIVYQPYSINYISEAKTVFEEVSRILKSNGIYHLMLHNPFVHGSWKDACWGSHYEIEELVNKNGYPISIPYRDGEPIRTKDPTWNFESTAGKPVKLPAPQEFKHTLSTVLNTLIGKKMILIKFEEYVGSDFNAEPGTWDHYTTIAPPWFFLWFRKHE